MITLLQDLRLARRALSADEPRIAVRIAWTFASALGALGLSCVAIGIAVNVLRGLRDDDVGLALLFVLLAWYGVLAAIWRPYRACRPVLSLILSTLICVTLPILALVLADFLRLGGRAERGAAAIVSAACAVALVIGWTRSLRNLNRQSLRLARAGRQRAALHSVITIIVASGLCFAAVEFIQREEEFFVLATVLCGAAFLLLLWVPTMARAHRMPLLDSEAQINVHCPSCGYSLIGLRELRCPECGTEFVLDDLIRAQEYDLDAPGPPQPAGHRASETAS